jgi:hypothetical protein
LHGRYTIQKGQGECKQLDFTYTERNGDKPIDEWLARKIKEYAKEKYGVSLDVRVLKKEEQDKKEASA